MDDKKSEKNKVFFITSNLTSIDKNIEYSLSNANGMKDFNLILKKGVKYKNEDFNKKVFYFEISKDELNEKDKDIISKKYKAKMLLKYNKQFEGIVLFKEGKNNFFYDFKFNEINDWTQKTYPPKYINFSRVEQLKIFNEALNILKVKQGDELYKSLVIDSQCYITGQPFFLDFYLQVFKSCYSQKEVKTLLMMFKLPRVKLPEKMELKEYRSVLKLIEKKPTILTKHCTEKDNPERYLKAFYTILLYFRVNYEKEIVQDLLNNENLSHYFVEILPLNYKYFANLDIPDMLISKILQQKNLSYKIIIGTLSYVHSIEKLLSIINNNYEIISNCCLNEKKKINMSELANPKKTDNLNNIIKEIEKLLTNKTIFISFDEQFWQNYIQFNDKTNLENLVHINKALLLYQKLDKTFNPDNLELNMKIHKTGLLLIENGKLKNEALINFIENEDIYFQDKKYESKEFRPLDILKGIDIEKADDKFFKKWNESNIFKIYSFIDDEFKKELINLIDDMQDFGKLLKLLKLFDYQEKKKIDHTTLILLCDKFKQLIRTYKIEECPNLINDVALFIYINQRQNNKDFLKNFIETNIKSVQTLNDIYICLFNNYKDISNNLMESIANYYTNNKDMVNVENIIFLLQKFNSKYFIKLILNRISIFIIKEEDIFNQEKEDINSFKLLDSILKLDLLKDPELSETNYIKSTVDLSKKILNDFKTGNIKYSNYKKNIIKDRLNIILLNNVGDVEECMKKLEEKNKKFLKILKDLKKLLGVLKEFYEIKYNDYIKEINNLVNQMNVEKLNYIEKEEIKNKIDKIQKIFQDFDLDKKHKLKDSKFFIDFFNTKKEKIVEENDAEDKIFSETEEDFKKLKSFFESNWIKNIDESIITQCYKTLKNMNDKKILFEFKVLRKYFDLKEDKINDLYLLKLTNEIQILSQKEEIFQTINSIIYFILEFKIKKNDKQSFGVKKTEFFDLLDKLRDELQKNISVDKIIENGKKLEKYGINILNQNQEDKDFINILMSLYFKRGSLNFILKLTDDDCRHLQELVSESENTFLKGADIQDLIKCNNFINNLGDIKETTTDQELIKIFKNKIIETKNISAYFAQYTNNCGQIQELFIQKLDKSQAKLKQIRNIIKNSTFILSIKNNDEPYLNFNGTFYNEKKGEYNIDLKNVKELRGRAMLTKKLAEQTEEEKKH